MAKRLSLALQAFLLHPARARAEITTPVLLWERAPSQPGRQRESLEGTLTDAVELQPTPTDPVLFRVEKSAVKGNAFALGVTLGSALNNDVVIEDLTVSRVHAYLQQGRGGWTVIDADSRNGTWAGEEPVHAKPVVLADRGMLRLGAVRLTFFLPATFVAYAQERVSRP